MGLVVCGGGSLIGVGALRDTTIDTTTWELADRDAYGTACDSGIAPHSLSFYFIG